MIGPHSSKIAPIYLISCEKHEFDASPCELLRAGTHDDTQAMKAIRIGASQKLAKCPWLELLGLN
jgi:hypothetical protein